jgi:nitronate monooxygenase
MTDTGALPMIIQGGMGVGVSDWRLARAVARRGQLGVISGTGLDAVLVRRLQLGDIGGHLRKAFDAFPIPEIAKSIWDRYFIPGGKAPGQAFKTKPVHSIKPPKALVDLTVLANFVEVYLAKLEHTGQVGINLLEKIQLPTVPSLFGAMLAKVDFVLMGAGIPRQIPAILDSLAKFQPTRHLIDVTGALSGETFFAEFDPRPYAHGSPTEIKRPDFLAIISSTVLAQTLARKCTPPVDGFVVEGPTAGGHNAPPRGMMTLDERNEPVYGPRDDVDLAVLRELGLPFWLAGSYGSPERIKDALAQGACGVQIGTPFAFCKESGIDPQLKARVVEKVLNGGCYVRTDPLASPTNFPFKVVELNGTMSEDKLYGERQRVCDLGYLRSVYRKEDGSVGYRCPSEPIEDYIKKGGTVEDTVGRQCICNGLTGTIGLSQTRHGVPELPILTAGRDIEVIKQFIKPGEATYAADDVLDVLLGVPAAHECCETEAWPSQQVLLRPDAVGSAAAG